MYALVKTGGKQYKVQEGDILNIEKLDIDEGSLYVFESILAVGTDDNGLMIGQPMVEGAKVESTILSHGKDKKVIVYKYKPKKGYRKKQGHRQPYTQVQIDKIVL